MVRYLFYTIGDLTYQSPLVLPDMIDVTGMKVLNLLSICVLQRTFLMQNIKVFPIQEVESPSISRQSAHLSGKIVSPTHRPPLPPGDSPGTHFC